MQQRLALLSLRPWGVVFLLFLLVLPLQLSYGLTPCGYGYEHQGNEVCCIEEGRSFIKPVPEEVRGSCYFSPPCTDCAGPECFYTLRRSKNKRSRRFLRLRQRLLLHRNLDEGIVLPPPLDKQVPPNCGDENLLPFWDCRCYLLQTEQDCCNAPWVVAENGIDECPLCSWNALTNQCSQFSPFDYPNYGCGDPVPTFAPTRSPTEERPWMWQQELTASDAMDGDDFGKHVDIDVDSLVVGAYFDSTNDTEHGSVYVFERSPQDGVWTETQKIVASDAGDRDYFGDAVAIQGDTLIVGARFDDTGKAFGNGEVYIYARNGQGDGKWTEAQRLSVRYGQTNAHFGDAVAIDGRTLVIGESGTNNYEGAVHVYIKPVTNWTRQTVLYPPRQIGLREKFGASVDISGSRAVVGAPGDYSNCQRPGYAMVFERAGDGSWDEGFILRSDEGFARDEFGLSVAIDGDTLVVATDDDSFVFQRTGPGNIWTQTQKLDSGQAVALEGDLLLADKIMYKRLPNGLWEKEQEEELKYGGGSSLLYKAAISGNTAALGYPSRGEGGAVSIFINKSVQPATLAPVSPPFSLSPTMAPSTRNPAEAFTPTPSIASPTTPGYRWVQQQELFAGDGVAGDQFGYAVAIDGDIIVSGSYQDEVNSIGQGTAYIFERMNDVWTETQKLLASDGGEEDDENDYFGRAVAVRGDTIVIGARFDDNGQGAYGNGGVYIFSRGVDGSWSETQKITVDCAQTNAHFGDSVAIDGQYLVIGEPGVRAAHVYVDSGSNWTMQAELFPPRPAIELFGASVDVSGNRVVVGAPGDYPYQRQGFAMVFEWTESGWDSGFMIRADKGFEGDEFGLSVAIEGDTVAVTGGQSGGATFVFQRSGPGNKWIQTQELDSGFPVALNGSYLLAGTTMFTRHQRNGMWKRQQEGDLESSSGGGFSYTVAISGNTSVLGHPFVQSSRGSVLIFANQPIPTTPTTAPVPAPSSPPAIATIVPTLTFLYPTMAPTVSKPTLAPTAAFSTTVPTNPRLSLVPSSAPTNASSTLEPTEMATTLSPPLNDTTVTPSLKPTEVPVAPTNPTTPAETNEPTVLPDGSRSASGSANRVAMWSALLVSVGTMFFVEIQ